MTRLALAALVAGAAWLPVAPAGAASNSQTSFAPTSTPAGARSFFDDALKPGATRVDTAVLTNMTSQPQTYVLYAADAGDVNGSFAIAGQQAHPTGVGAWVTLDIHRLVLGPHRHRTVRVTIKVPRNATPGDHAGGVVALSVGPSAVDSRSSLQVQAHYGVGIRIYAHVAGRPVPRVTLTHLSLTPSGGLLGSLLGRDRAAVRYRVSNVGNVRVTPTADGVVSTFGRSVRVPAQPLGELLPGSAADRSFAVDGLRWTSLLGVMRAHVTVLAGAGLPPVEAEVTVWTVPWLLIAALAAATFTVVMWRRSHRRRNGQGHSDPPTPGEELSDQLVGV